VRDTERGENLFITSYFKYHFSATSTAIPFAIPLLSMHMRLMENGDREATRLDRKREEGSERESSTCLL